MPTNIQSSNNKHMGQSCRGGQALTVATLNFSGINTNRFEFHDGSGFFDELNAKYKLIQDKQFPEMKQWKGVSFDKNYKSHRFTVLFGEELINCLKNRLFTQQQFRTLWKEHFLKAKLGRTFLNKYNPTDEEVEDVLKMDYTFYRAVVMVAYRIHSLEDYQQKIAIESSAQLKQFLLKIKQRPPFQLQVKQELVEAYYRVTDVMFLQEAGSVKWNKHAQYTKIQNHDSVIMYKTEVLGAPDTVETQKWKELLDINHDSAYIFTNKDYLLISTHFKSSKEEYLQQTQQLKSALNTILKQHPRPLDLKIIVGMDANHFIQKIGLSRQCYLVPQTFIESTSIKKRTFIQAQLNKADKAVNQVKDHILSTLPIADHWLELVDGEDSRHQLLPNRRHPYDHFIVKARLKVQGCC